MTKERATKGVGLRASLTLVCLMLAGMAFAANAPAQAAPPTQPGVAVTLPIEAIPATPPRRALIIAPASIDGAMGMRNSVARVDAGLYRDLLRLVGFEVTLLIAETRPQLDTGVRDFAQGLPPNTEVAVFALGTILPKDDDLYFIASEMTPDLIAKPAVYATEGLRLFDLLRRITDRAPKDVALLVDECRVDEAHPACAVSANSVPDGVSAIVGMRLRPTSSDAPLAGLASLRTEMIPLMQQEGLSYLDLFGRLKDRLQGANMRVASSPSLSRAFAFIPNDYWTQLQNGCARVDRTASADALARGASVDPLVSACERALVTYPFAGHYKDRLALVREQSAFQHAAAACDGAAQQAYLSTYPGGLFRDAVVAVQARCAPPPVVTPPEPPRAPEPAKTEQSKTEPNPAEESQTCVVFGLDPNGNNWLALRYRPSYQSPWSETHMGPGTVVTRLDESGDWLKVRLQSGETGWAGRRFLACGTQDVPPPREAKQEARRETAPVTTCFVDGLDPNGNNWLALRRAPSFKAAWSTTHLGPGTPVAVIDQQGEWWHVRLRNGEMGWANQRFLRCPE